MTDDTIQIIAIAVASIAQVYMLRPDAMPFAGFWNMLAVIFGVIANFFGRLALVARLNYLDVVNNGT